jgi:hypothetical protein
MKNLTNYTKIETGLKSLERLREVIKIGSNLVVNVFNEDMAIFVSAVDGLELLSFNNETWNKAVCEMVEDIKTRPDPEERYESWECSDNPRDFPSTKKRTKLVELRQNYRSRIAYKRKYPKQDFNKKNLEKFCDEFKVPHYMGNLFINELRADSNPINDSARNYAKFLGLI